jgi:hypothetical protein
MSVDITRELAISIFWSSDAPLTIGRVGNAYCQQFIPAQLGTYSDEGMFGIHEAPARRQAVVFAMGATRLKAGPVEHRYLYVTCGEHIIVPPFPDELLPYLPGMEPDDVRLPGYAG